MKHFRLFWFTLAAAFFAVVCALGQSSAPAANDDASAITFAQKAAVRALNFKEGDLAGFTRAKNDFTASGWRDFMKQFEGFLGAKGAPQYSSEFDPSGPPVVVRHENGVVAIAIPGKLIQTHLQSRTTYRLVVTLLVSGDPPKVTHLDQTTCGGDSTAAPCK